MTGFKDLIAGIFVLVALLLFLLFLGWASDVQAWFTERKEVTLLLKRAVPIPQGAMVRYLGIPVGDVKRMRLRTAEERAAHPDYRIALDLALEPHVPLSTETRVFVTGDGLLGSRYVDVRAARTDAPPLPPGKPLLGLLGGVDSFLVRMDELTNNLMSVLERVDRLVAPDGGKGSLPELIGRTSELVEGVDGTRRAVDDGVVRAKRLLDEVEPGVKDLLAELRNVSTEAEATLREFRAILGENRGKVGRLLDDGQRSLTRLTDRMDELGAEAEQALQRFDGLLVRNDRNIFLTLHHLRVAAEELKLAMARIRADPSQVLWGGSENPDAAEAAAKKSQERDLLDKGFLPPRWKR